MMIIDNSNLKGKRVFIQGYWKGALRHMKDTAFQNLEPRERELVTSE